MQVKRVWAGLLALVFSVCSATWGFTPGWYGSGFQPSRLELESFPIVCNLHEQSGRWRSLWGCSGSVHACIAI